MWNWIGMEFLHFYLWWQSQDISFCEFYKHIQYTTASAFWHKKRNTKFKISIEMGGINEWYTNEKNTLLMGTTLVQKWYTFGWNGTEATTSNIYHIWSIFLSCAVSTREWSHNDIIIIIISSIALFFVLSKANILHTSLTRY